MPSSISVRHYAALLLIIFLSGCASLPALREYRIIYDAPPAVELNGYDYYLDQYKGTGFEALYRKGPGGDITLALNPEYLIAHYGSAALSAIRISPDNNHLALKLNGPEHNNIIICNFSEPQQCRRGPEAYQFEWGERGEEIFYTQLEKLRATALYSFNFRTETSRLIRRAANDTENIIISRDSKGEIIISSEGSESTGGENHTFKDFSVSVVREGLHKKIFINSARGRERLNLPKDYGTLKIHPGQSSNGNGFTFSLSTPILPPRRYFYNFLNHKIEIQAQAKLNPLVRFSAENYRSDSVRVASPDGTEVPVSIFYRTPKSRAKQPLLLYVYGAYGKPLDLSFSPFNLFLMDRGFTIAFAHVRGGGEFGIAWHLAGSGANKFKGSEDYIAIADFLQKLGNSGSIYAAGRSAGALIVKQAVIQRPALFAGAILSYPFLDSAGYINTLPDGLAVKERREWGSSPRPDPVPVTLPPILIIAAKKDEVIPFAAVKKWHQEISALNLPAVPYLHVSETASHAGEPLSFLELRENEIIYNFMRRLEG